MGKELNYFLDRTMPTWYNRVNLEVRDMKKTWTDTEVRAMRDEVALGASITQTCLKYGISGGHLDRILRGVARMKAGGPIRGDKVLPDGRSEEEILLSMPKEQLDKYLSDRVDKYLENNKPKAGGVTELTERALAYGARPRPGVSLPTVTRAVEDLPEVSESGIPLPPDWKDFVSDSESVVKPTDADQLLDELEKLK